MLLALCGIYRLNKITTTLYQHVSRRFGAKSLFSWRMSVQTGFGNAVPTYSVMDSVLPFILVHVNRSLVHDTGRCNCGLMLLNGRWGGKSIALCTVGSFRVVVLAPLFSDHLCVLDAEGDPTSLTPSYPTIWILVLGWLDKKQSLALAT
jgi:hypothetical protein